MTAGITELSTQLHSVRQRRSAAIEEQTALEVQSIRADRTAAIRADRTAAIEEQTALEVQAERSNRRADRTSSNRAIEEQTVPQAIEQ